MANVTTTTPRKRLAAALGLVRADPEGVAALDREAKEAAEAAAAEAKRRTDAEARVAKATPDRTRALVADFEALWSAAVLAAAERLARRQSEAELGLIPPSALAIGGYQVRLRLEDVEREYAALSTREPVPWRQGRSAADVAGQMARNAAETIHPPAPPVKVDDVATRVAKRQAEMQATRERQNAERKRAAGIKT
jgi:hypothetical protein